MPYDPEKYDLESVAASKGQVTWKLKDKKTGKISNQKELVTPWGTPDQKMVDDGAGLNVDEEYNKLMDHRERLGGDRHYSLAQQEAAKYFGIDVEEVTYNEGWPEYKKGFEQIMRKNSGAQLPEFKNPWGPNE